MKNRTTIFAFILATLMLVGCSSTEEKAAANNEVQVHEADEVTCKTVVKTGSRVGKKVCKTNRAWLETARRAQEYKEGITRKSGHVGSASN